MTASHGLDRHVCLVVSQIRRPVQSNVIRVAIGKALQSLDQKRHSSTSRIPGSARPSRIAPRHTSSARHVRPSDTHQDILQPGQEENSSRTPVEHQLANDQTTASTSVVEATGNNDDSSKNIITPSTIEDVLGQDTLVVTREIEMMNVFLGFEQANKYAIKNAKGDSVGYLAESEKGVLGGSIQRQVLRNHRPFEAQILDTSGNGMMIIRRPFTFINSKISIYMVNSLTKEEDLVGEVHQIFHVIRRKYELFVNKGGQRGEEDLEQFAQIDEGLWAWDFMLQDDNARPLGAISRNFRGFGRELFTDTGQYVVTFDPTTLKSDLRIENSSDEQEKEEKKDASLSNTSTGRELTTSGPIRPLTLQERAVTLATAISADFDYFSRHSQSSTGGFMPYFWMGGGSGEKGEPVPQGEGIEGEGGSVGKEGDVPGGAAGGGGGGGAGDEPFGGNYSQGEPGPTPDQGYSQGGPDSMAEQGSTGDFGQGQEDVWGKEDPWGEASPTGDSNSGWGWGSNSSGGGGDGGGDGGGSGWLDGFFDG